MAKGNRTNHPPKYTLEQLLVIAEKGVYTPELLPLIQRMAMLGATNVEIAAALNVTIETFKHYCMIYPEMTAVLRAGKEVSDDVVERSLYMKAIGYAYPTIKNYVVDKTIVPVEEVVHVQPSTTAQIFWLKNRRPDAWKDVQRHEHGAAGEFESLSDEEVAKRLAQFVGQQPAPLQIDEPQPGITRKRDGSKLN